MLLRLPEPYDFELSLGRYRRYGTDLAHRLVDDTLFRAVAGREVRIVARPGGVDVEPHDERTLAEIGRMLGLPFDLTAFSDWAARDRVLAPIVGRLRGYRPTLHTDAFEALFSMVTAQQVSLFAAHAISNRVIERFGERHGEAWAFPTRERIAAARVDDLVALGFMRRKAEYVTALARSDVDLDSLDELDDDAVREVVVAQPGFGPWSAEWFLARFLARPRAWPAGDLVLRKAALDLYGVDVTELGERLDPFQNLSAQYLMTEWLTRT